MCFSLTNSVQAMRIWFSWTSWQVLHLLWGTSYIAHVAGICGVAFLLTNVINAPRTAEERSLLRQFAWRNCYQHLSLYMAYTSAVFHSRCILKHVLLVLVLVLPNWALWPVFISELIWEIWIPIGVDLSTQGVPYFTHMFVERIIISKHFAWTYLGIRLPFWPLLTLPVLGLGRAITASEEMGACWLTSLNINFTCLQNSPTNSPLT